MEETQEKKNEVKTSFIGKNTESPRAKDEDKKSKPIYDDTFKVWFVNGSKYRRAQDTLALITNKRTANKQEEVSRKEHYIKQLAVHDIAPDSKEALPALYEILGGLIRTDKEQKQADERAKQMREKKRMIE